MHGHEYQREILKARYRKLSTIGRYLFIFLLVVGIAFLFLPPWVFRIFKKVTRNPEAIITGQNSIFGEYGWEAVGWVALGILVIMLFYFSISGWASARHYR